MLVLAMSTQLTYGRVLEAHNVFLTLNSLCTYLESSGPLASGLKAIPGDRFPGRVSKKIALIYGFEIQKCLDLVDSALI